MASANTSLLGNDDAFLHQAERAERIVRTLCVTLATAPSEGPSRNGPYWVVRNPAGLACSAKAAASSCAYGM
jgi:hypothetical protein